MSAEILRRAASLMRERAEAAEQQPWRAYDVSEWIKTSPSWEVGYTAAEDVPLVGGEEVALANYLDKEDAEHIASWHPAVALAVADWLDAAYEDWHYSEHSIGAMSVRAMSGTTNDPDPNALAVALAYLGES